MRGGFGLAGAAIFLGIASGGLASVEPAPTANANIVRSASGTIAYRVKSTGAVNGFETWRLTVHPDGSRTMAATVAYAPRDVQRHIISRVAADWRPIETYALYWIDGAWKGSALVAVDGTNLYATASTPAGPKSQVFTTSPYVSVVPHVLAVDSWRAMRVDRTKTAGQAVPSYSLSAVGDGPDALLGKLMNYNLTYIGAEDVTVPAGTFATDHFRIEDAVDIYLSGPDGIVVKFVYAAIDREHHLIELNRGSEK